MKVLALSLLILLGACTAASITTASGDSVEFTRVWSDVTFTLGSDGSMSYSSNADPNTQLLQGFLSGQLNAVP